jgi:hypothetical protein
MSPESSTSIDTARETFGSPGMAGRDITSCLSQRPLSLRLQPQHRLGPPLLRRSPGSHQAEDRQYSRLSRTNSAASHPPSPTRIHQRLRHRRLARRRPLVFTPIFEGPAQSPEGFTTSREGLTPGCEGRTPTSRGRAPTSVAAKGPRAQACCATGPEQHHHSRSHPR